MPEKGATDMGYDANSLRARLAASKTEAVIPSNTVAQNPHPLRRGRLCVASLTIAW